MKSRLSRPELREKAYAGSVLFGLGVSSTNRCSRLLDLLDSAETESLFWLAFNAGWSACDLISPEEQQMLWLKLCIHHDEYLPGFIPYMHGPSRRWWLKQKDRSPLNVYRGCGEGRVKSLSWTLSRQVAIRFARGHRGIQVVNPVVAEAEVEWDDVLFATNERKEEEVLIDFKGANIITITPMEFDDKA